MTTTAIAEQILTVEAYLAFEKTATIRHEFYYGKLIEMPGEAKNANRIAKNLLLNWNDALDNQGLEMFTHDIKTRVKEDKIYRYPDVVVAPIADDTDDYLVLHPVLIAEVASEDSYRTDTGAKLREYLKLPTLRYYIIISQEEMYVQLHIRKNGDWVMQLFEEADEVIELPNLSVKISLKELYKRIQF
jgi:Uma2 family endonuclease